MPTGGTWTTQNKVRAGAYINFVSVDKPISALTDRGVVAVACNLNWGPEAEVIKLTGADLLNGRALFKIGYDGVNTATLPIRCALSGAYTCYFIRLQTSCAKATTTVLTNATVTAKYGGTFGNRISVKCVLNSTTNKYDFSVLVDGEVKETASVSDYTALEAYEFELIDLSHTETVTIAAFDETTLTGGSNGSAITTSDFATNVLSKLEHINFNVFAVEGAATTYNSIITSQLDVWRNKRGKRTQAVLYEAYNAYTLDREDVISVCQGFTTSDETVTTALFPIWVASQEAGAAVNQSLTAKEISDAVSITGHDFLEDEISDYLDLGKFMLTTRQDGAIVIEKDINSLHTFTTSKNYAFSKNRVMRVLDQIGNDITIVFNKNYCGKVSNEKVGRATFKSEVVHLIDQLQDLAAVQNFDSSTDITIMQGEAVDSVVVDMEIQPVDSMEKLYMTVNVNA